MRLLQLMTLLLLAIDFSDDRGTRAKEVSQFDPTLLSREKRRELERIQRKKK